MFECLRLNINIWNYLRLEYAYLLWRKKKKATEMGGGEECMWMCSLIQRIKMALFLQCFSRLQAAKTNMFTILALTQCEWQHLSCGWRLNLLRMVQRNPCRRNLIIKKFTTHCSLDLPNSRRTVLFILSCRQSRDASECFLKKKIISQSVATFNDSSNQVLDQQNCVRSAARLHTRRALWANEVWCFSPSQAAHFEEESPWKWTRNIPSS